MAGRTLDERFEVSRARPGVAEEVLALMRAYCDFYECSPSDAGLLEMAAALTGDAEQGAMFVAREGGGRAVGFAALCWKWSSTRGARIGVMEDLFVAPEARGAGVAETLIEACAGSCRERGMPAMEWVTAPDNERARAVYERVGGEASTWVAYELKLDPGGR